MTKECATTPQMSISRTDPFSFSTFTTIHLNMCKLTHTTLNKSNAIPEILKPILYEFSSKSIRKNCLLCFLVTAASGLGNKLKIIPIINSPIMPIIAISFTMSSLPSAMHPEASRPQFPNQDCYFHMLQISRRFPPMPMKSEGKDFPATSARLPLLLVW